MKICNIKSTEKPTQPTSDIEILLKSAVFVKPIFDKQVSLITDAFSKQNNIYNLSVKKAPNKTKERAEKKVKECDVKGYNGILDYTRGAIIFKTLEDLFNFVNFTRNFKFPKLHLEDTQNNKPEMFKYIANNFSLNEKSLTDSDKQIYPFLKGQSNLKTTEYMDLKMYIKIPTKSSESDKEGFIVTELACILEGFWKYYDLTHYLYEGTRNKENTEKMTEEENLINKAKTYLAYHVHRHYVIEKYNKNPNNKIKLIEIDPKKEEDKNNFFAYLTKSKIYILDKVEKEISNKAKEDKKNYVSTQIQNLISTIKSAKKQTINFINNNLHQRS